MAEASERLGNLRLMPRESVEDPRYFVAGVRHRRLLTQEFDEVTRTKASKQ